MEKLNRVLATIYYLIWIPVGLLVMAGMIFLIVANPVGRFLESMQFGPGGGGPGGGGGPSGGQFMDQGRP